MKRAAGVVAAMALAGWAVSVPQEASAHGRRHYDNPPVVVAPPGHRAQPYPYWYYSRPQPRHHAPPVIVMPAPGRHFHHRHHRPYHNRHSPGATFHFRF